MTCMRRQKGPNWKPKEIFLLPNSYKIGEKWPSKKSVKDDLKGRGYGPCVFQDGVPRSWTREEFVREILEKCDEDHAAVAADLRETGVQFAKISPHKRRLLEVNFEEVSGLEEEVKRGILVILQQGDVELPHEIIRPPDDQNPCRLKIAHLNMQSLFNKLGELEVTLRTRVDVDVMTLSETMLKSSRTNECLAIPGYTIAARKDGAMGRGGVLTYVRKDSPLFSFKECPVQLAGGTVCVELSVGGRAEDDPRSKCEEILRIVNVYVPPSTRQQSADLQKITDNMNKLKGAEKCCHNVDRQNCTCRFEYVILGDFNVDLNSNSDKSTHIKKVDKLTILKDTHHLQQLVTEVTRKFRYKQSRGMDGYRVTKTVIDLIYTENTEWDSRVIPIAMSDHYMVCCSREVKVNDGLTQQIEAWSRDLKEQRKTAQNTKRVLLKLIIERDEAKENDDWDLFEERKQKVKQKLSEI